jgi:hypothetical protein
LRVGHTFGSPELSPEPLLSLDEATVVSVGGTAVGVLVGAIGVDVLVGDVISAGAVVPQGTTACIGALLEKSATHQ